MTMTSSKTAHALLAACALLLATAPSPSPAVEGATRGYVVVMRRGPALAALAPAARSAALLAKVDALASAHGVRPERRFSHALGGFSAQLSDAEAGALRTDPDVAIVEEDRPVWLVATQTSPDWGLDRMDQRSLPLDSSYTYTLTGSGVQAYVVDSGIDGTHSEFTGRMGTGKTWVTDGYGTGDCIGHGTHVAGTIGGTTYGVAKSVTLHSTRVFDCSGSGLDSTIIDALDWVVANATLPAVVNMSLGGDPSSALDAAVEGTVAAGIPVVVAAGNDTLDACDFSPAREPTAITVGATGDRYNTSNRDAIADYSNYGTCVDLFAPGSLIRSSIPGDLTGVYSGTSMATPHVAGAAALLLQSNPSATPAQIAAAITAAASTQRVLGSLFEAPNLLLYVGTVAEAWAGKDRTVAPGMSVTLSGRASVPFNDTVSSYQWDQTAGPSVSLTGATTASPSFTAPAAASVTPLTFKLTITTAGGASANDSVTITDDPAWVDPPPTAVIAAVAPVVSGAFVTLDGTGSYDAVGTVVAYSWAQLSGPTVVLGGAATANAYFMAPTVTSSTELVFELTVTDDVGETGTAQVTVTVGPQQTPPPQNPPQQPQSHPSGCSQLGGGGCSSSGAELGGLLSFVALFAPRRRRREGR